MARFYFIDFEASSLSDLSYPIEVAWVDQDGHGESYLISPAPDWTDWSSQSEAIHNISHQMLKDHGASHRKVAQRAARILGSEGVQVYADQPAFDGRWLRVLLASAGLPQIQIRDVTEKYGEACRPLFDAAANQQQAIDKAFEIVAAAENAEAMLSRTRHRALPDAQGLWWTWRRIQSLVAKELARGQ